MTSQCRVCSRKLFFILRNIQHALEGGGWTGDSGLQREGVPAGVSLFSHGFSLPYTSENKYILYI